MYPVEVTKDLQYATAHDESLTLDLYRPRTSEQVPVVLYLHGGGFRGGDKADDAEKRLAAIARYGIAVASANYRLAPTAIHPAQIHDAKAAVRWLRAHGPDHGLRVDRIGVWGASAGGYLASMVGLTANDPNLEGDMGEELDHSAEVQAAVAWFSPSDLIASSRRSWLEEQILDPPVENGLFGRDNIHDDDAEVTLASPIQRVHRDAPPFLIVNGDRDRVVSEFQGRALHDALARIGVDVTFCVLGGAGHEDHHFDSDAHLAMTAAWLRAQLA